MTREKPRVTRVYYDWNKPVEEFKCRATRVYKNQTDCKFSIDSIRPAACISIGFQLNAIYFRIVSITYRFGLNFRRKKMKNLTRTRFDSNSCAGAGPLKTLNSRARLERTDVVFLTAVRVLFQKFSRTFSVRSADDIMFERKNR